MLRKNHLIIFGVSPLVVIGLTMIWFHWSRAVFIAASRNDMISIRRYLSDGGDPNVRATPPNDWYHGSRSLLSWAVRKNAPGTAGLILRSDRFLMPILDFSHPVFDAIAQDNSDTVALFMRHGLRPESKRAARYGETREVSIILEALHQQKWVAVRGMLPFLKKPVDWGVILCCSQWRDPSEERVLTIELMLQMGMSPDIRICGERSLLSLAAEHDDILLARSLLRFGANPRLSDADDKSPLMHIQTASPNAAELKDALNVR